LLFLVYFPYIYFKDLVSTFSI